jgi:hypothetical protein
MLQTMLHAVRPTYLRLTKPVPPTTPEAPSTPTVRAGNLDAGFTNAAEAISKMTHVGALEGMLRTYRLELADYQAKKLPIPEFLAGNLAAVEERLKTLGVTVNLQRPHPAINPGLTDWQLVIAQVTTPADNGLTVVQKVNEHAKAAVQPNSGIGLPTYNKLA